MNLSKKAGNISPSITLSITAKANELKAQGVDVVSFGAGEPDFNTPQNIINAAIKAMQDGKTKYTPAGGILELKKTICKTLKENNYKYTIEDLEKAVSDKTKAILINSPNNPTGTIYNREELIEIAEFAKKHDLLIISDEIYEKLIYDGEKHISIASLSQDAFERTVVINGVSKTYAMTGWRLGYMAASKEITKLMTSIQSHMTSNVNTIAQYAAIEALNGPIEDLNTMVKEFERRRNFMVDRLSKIDGVSIIKPSGAFYIMVNISSYFNTTFKGEEIKNSLDFSRVLLDEEKVAVIPGAGFGLDEYIRLSYATSMDIIETGIDRIAMFINKIK